MTEQYPASNELPSEKMEFVLHPETVKHSTMLGLLDDTSVAEQVLLAIDLYYDVLSSGATVLWPTDVPEVIPARGVLQTVRMTLDDDRRQKISEIIESLGGDESLHVGKAVDYHFRTRTSQPDIGKQIDLARKRERLRRAEQADNL